MKPLFSVIATLPMLAGCVLFATKNQLAEVEQLRPPQFLRPESGETAHFSVVLQREVLRPCVSLEIRGQPVKLLISKLLLGKLAAGGGSAEADRRSRQAEGILRMSSGEEDLYGCERTSAQLPLEY